MSGLREQIQPNYKFKFDATSFTGKDLKKILKVLAINPYKYTKSNSFYKNPIKIKRIK